MAIEFERSVDESRFKSPLEGFETVTEEVKHRRDPLTGRTARIVSEVFPHPDESDGIDLEAVVGDGEDCFFCPGTVDEATPEYPDAIGGGRGKEGAATSFPNLFPYAKHSNVVVLTEEHFRPIDGLGADRLADGLACGLDYIRSVSEHDGSRFASVNMNFLRSSGSSVYHPHMQAMADDHGTDRQAEIVRLEREYHDEHGSRYWRDLLDRERDGDRYVGRTGDVEWLAPFAPLGQYHVAGVVGTDGSSIPNEDDAADIADGIENVLEYYAEQGLNAFNFGLRLAPEDPESTAVVDIVARAPFGEHYVSDAFFAQSIHGQTVVDAEPEAYAEDVAEQF